MEGRQIRQGLSDEYGNYLGKDPRRIREEAFIRRPQTKGAMTLRERIKLFKSSEQFRSQTQIERNQQRQAVQEHLYASTETSRLISGSTDTKAGGARLVLMDLPANPSAFQMPSLNKMGQLTPSMQQQPAQMQPMQTLAQAQAHTQAQRQGGTQSVGNGLAQFGAMTQAQRTGVLVQNTSANRPGGLQMLQMQAAAATLAQLHVQGQGGPQPASNFQSLGQMPQNIPANGQGT